MESGKGKTKVAAGYARRENPLLPLRPNRHPKRDETPTEWGIIHSS